MNGNRVSGKQHTHEEQGASLTHMAMGGWYVGSATRQVGKPVKDGRAVLREPCYFSERIFILKG